MDKTFIHYKFRIDEELEKIILDYSKITSFKRKASFKMTFCKFYILLAEKGYMNAIKDDIEQIQNNKKLFSEERIDALEQIKIRFAEYEKKFFELDYGVVQSKSKGAYLYPEHVEKINKIRMYLMENYRITANEGIVLRGAIFYGGLDAYLKMIRKRNRRNGRRIGTR